MLKNRFRSGLIALFVGIMMLIATIPASAAFWNMTGDTYAHDPTLIKSGNTWYNFNTGPGIQLLTSTNGTNWTRQSQVFNAKLSWWSSYVPDQEGTDVWAPDIEFFNGRYWMYYSISTFGSRVSAIGLTSTASLSSPSWRDDGVVTSTNNSNNYNAIDPNLTIDAAGVPWLAFGSWNTGLKLTQINPTTMKPTGSLYSIASRSNNAIEAPSITYRNGYYYLFASIDNCCQGVNSTYKIIFGRSKTITGPYLDKNGVSLTSNGGTILDSGNAVWKGPGGQDIYNGNIIARHAYDANENGAAKLLINDLYWDAEGWPTYEQAATYRLVNRKSGKAADVYNFSTADGGDVVQWTDLNGANQQWSIVDVGGGYHKLININSGKAMEVYNFSTANSGDVVQWADLGGTNQQWLIQETTNGYYKLINRNSGKVLEVNAGSTANGANIVQYTDNGGTNQQWQLVRIN
jgi:arabinan endo-1,5-alpha-L-arabinosidase